MHGVDEEEGAHVVGEELHADRLVRSQREERLGGREEEGVGVEEDGALEGAREQRKGLGGEGAQPARGRLPDGRVQPRQHVGDGDAAEPLEVGGGRRAEGLRLAHVQHLHVPYTCHTHAIHVPYT